jgi:hypothetical protein
MGSAWEVHAAFAEAGHDEEFCLSLEAFFKTLSQFLGLAKFQHRTSGLQN